MSESLNIQLAKLLGWTVKFAGDPEVPNMFCLLNPQGGLEYHSTDADFAWDGIPDFERSSDASMTVLPVEFDLGIRSRIEGGYTASLFSDPLMSSKQGRWQGEGATRAEALARALLAYLEWKEEQKQDRNPIERGEG